MGSWRLFALKNGEDDIYWRRERLPDCRIERAFWWAVAHGADKILFEPDARPSFPCDCVHHVCSDPDCPGGC